MKHTIKRLQKLNEVALAAYVKSHCGDLKSKSDPRCQGVELNRIAVGILMEEEVELNRIFDKRFESEIKKQSETDKNVSEIKNPKNFRAINPNPIY